MRLTFGRPLSDQEIEFVSHSTSYRFGDLDLSIEVPGGLTLQTDVAPTEWVDESLLPHLGQSEGVRVGEIVPTGFEAYARILHPASRRVGDRFEPVTWSELARMRGKTIHPEVQLKALLGDEFRHSRPWGELPEEDSIPEGLRAPLVDILGSFTRTPDRCWFCIWEGYGDLVRWPRHEDVLGHVQVGPASAEAGGDPSRKRGRQPPSSRSRRPRS
jgi:hypothetical protein